MLEAPIAYHCAPALAGIKPANIVSCQKSKNNNIYPELEKLNSELNCKDIYLEVLCECEKRLLVMVYRKALLERYLNDRANKAFLAKYGYSQAISTESHLETLKSRMEFDSFPHEIGVFLGYPLRDIHCFINHRDRGCLLCGEWKVYHNVPKAEKLFKRYRSCRKALSKRVASGCSLAKIFCAA